jgi:hypothetical protein
VVLAAGGAQPTPKPRKRSFPRWAKITADAVAAFVLFGVGVGVGAGASDHTKLDAANKQAVTLQGKLTTTQSQFADVRGQLTRSRATRPSPSLGDRPENPT